MDMRQNILRACEAEFDRAGYGATGMDRLAAVAQVSTRTLYKHGQNKSALLRAILEERGERFLNTVRDPGPDGIFTAFGAWIEAEGARGCFFLRMMSEAGAQDPEIGAAVLAYKDRLREAFRASLEAEGLDPDAGLLLDQVLVLFEGATFAAVYRGANAVDAARRTLALLLGTARGSR